LRRFGRLAVAAGVAIVGAAEARAALTVYDSFSYGPGPVAGQNGGFTGFAGGYTGAGNVTEPGLTYPGVYSTGNKFTTAGSNGGAFRTLLDPIDPNNGGTIFVGFLISLAQVEPADYGGISFFSGGTSTEELFLGRPSLQNYGYRAPGAIGNDDIGGGPAPSTATTLLVYRLTFTAAGDRIDAYYNPDPRAPLPATPGNTSDIPDSAFPAAFTSIRLQSGTQARSFNFDEFRIGTTFADVVPEPSAAGLLAAAAAAGLRRRRRRA